MGQNSLCPDVGKNVGLGHYKRQLSVALKCREFGLEPSFLVSNTELVKEELSHYKINFFLGDERQNTAIIEKKLSKQNFEVLVVDSYSLDPSLSEKIS